MTRSVFVVLMILISISSVHAQQRSDQLLWSCTGVADNEAEAIMGKTYCIGYISGIIDSYRLLSDVNKDIRFICFPPTGISNDHAMQVVIKWFPYSK